MRRNTLTVIAFLSALILGGLAGSLNAADRPNVIVLLADDLGWTGLNCFGSDLYETPHLDQLAKSGMKFTDAYAACTVCSPTRASIMTGMYPARLHLTDFIAGQNRPFAKLRIPDWTKRLEHRHVTLAEALGAAGYQTLHVGKWHLASSNGDRDGAPTRHGFDVSVEKPAQAKGYHLPPGFNADGESGSDYVTDYLTDKALELIDRHKQDPFFLYFAYHTPHTPIQGRSDLVEYFETKVRDEAEHQNPVFAAMVSSLDQSVGRIRARLQKHDIDKHTIIIFLSDNGGLTQRYGKPDHFTSNAPLRRGKGSAYEGGVRVPAIISWPGVVAAASECREPVMSIDLYPTILAMTGTSADPQHAKNLDGKDLTGLLRQENAKLDRDLFWHYPHYHAGGDSPYTAIRSGDWRLIQFHEDNRLALYNLRDDIGEQTDLASTHPARAEELLSKLRAWRQQVGAQMPTDNPNFDASRQTEVARRNRK